MNKEKHLYRIFFLLSIILLLLNDLYLKYEFHNALTGKLSDFAGLFAFPYFFSCFFPRKSFWIYVLTGLLFVFWKSHLSQSLIDFAQVYNLWINRTIDYTDLFSLIMLPISYFYWKSDVRKAVKYHMFIKTFVIGVCCYTFIATSMPQHYEEKKLYSGYKVEVDLELEMVKSKLHMYKDNIATFNYYSIEFPERNAYIFASINATTIGQQTTAITLDSIFSFTVKGSGFIFGGGVDESDVNYMKNLSLEELEERFKRQIKVVLKDNE